MVALGNQVGEIGRNLDGKYVNRVFRSRPQNRGKSQVESCYRDVVPAPTANRRRKLVAQVMHDALPDEKMVPGGWNMLQVSASLIRESTHRNIQRSRTALWDNGAQRKGGPVYCHVRFGTSRSLAG